MTALHIAVHHKHAAVVQELVRQPDKEVLNARDHVSWWMCVCVWGGGGGGGCGGVGIAKA